MTSETPHAYLGVLIPKHKLNCVSVCVWGVLSKQAAFSSGQMLCCMHVRLVSKRDS